MTRIKSLKYGVEKQGHGFIHRVHRSKKNRLYRAGKDLTGRRRRKIRLEQLKEEALYD